MKNKRYNLLVLILILIFVSAAGNAHADSAREREYQVKAAFVYNFIKFIDWPEEKIPADSKSITIAVIADNDFIKTFDPIKSKQVKGKNILIKPFIELDKLNELQKKNNSAWKETIRELKKCQVLFICTCGEKNEKVPVELLEEMKDSGILLVGEIPGFLENGGTINFVMEDKKVRFEVNTTVADRNALKIKSQLLKLAKRVLRKEPDKEEEK